MNAPSNFQQLLLRYLLDDLPPDERAQIDDALITDQHFSDSFQEAQWDLIDAYTANELPLDIRKRVEQAFFSGRNRISLPLASAKREVPTTQIKHRKFGITVLASTLAACIMLAVVFIHFHTQPNPQPAQLAHVTASIPGEAAPSGKPQSVQSQTPIAKPTTGRHIVPEATGLMVVAMPMETMRGSTSIPIHVGRAVNRIEIQWPLPTGSSTPSYTLEVASDHSNTTLLPQHGRTSTVEDIHVAEFIFPANMLPDGEYLFRLNADTPDNTLIAESSVRISH